MAAIARVQFTNTEIQKAFFKGYVMAGDVGGRDEKIETRMGEMGITKQP